MPTPWKVSLHGGHSGDYNLHGSDTLHRMLDAAVEFGYATFGVTAHSPRSHERFLYPEEIAAGYGPQDLQRDFAAYATACDVLVGQYADRLEVLRAAEIEVVPSDAYVEEMDSLRARFSLDYLVGSVHWIDELPIDTSRSDFQSVVRSLGGLEPFLIRYYELVHEMLIRLQPEVIGHLDLPRLFAAGEAELESERVRKSVTSVLESARSIGSILEVNVRAIEKGLVDPYPAPWIVRLATEIGVPLCFSDDSHSIHDVGRHIEEGREYLLGAGVESITKLTRIEGSIEKQRVSLN